MGKVESTSTVVGAHVIASEAVIGDAARVVVDPVAAAASLGIDKTSFAATDVADESIALSTNNSTATSGTVAAGLYAICGNVDCHYETAAAPTATRTHKLLPAGACKYLYVASAQKIAAIVATDGETGVVTIEQLVAD